MGYDVIIVGAGSAGCVLAARLSADPERSVLLPEAGPDYPDPTALPPDVASSLRTTNSHDWGYVSEPGRLGREFALPRGKLVGGCSAINGAVAVTTCASMSADCTRSDTIVKAWVSGEGHD